MGVRLLEARARARDFISDAALQCSPHISRCVVRVAGLCTVMCIANGDSN